MFNSLKSIKIKTKIIAVAFIAIFLSVGISSSSIYLYLNPILGRQVVRDNNAIVMKITQQVSYCMEDVINYARGIILNDQVQSMLKKAQVLEGYNYYVNIFRLEKVLKEYSLLRDNIIVDMFIIDNNNRVLELKNLYTDTLKEEWYDDFRANKTLNGFSTQHSITLNSTSSRFNVVSYVMNIYDKYNPDIYLGKLVIHINYDVLIKPMIIDRSLGLKIMTFNQKNNTVYSPSDLNEEFIEVPSEKLEDVLPMEGVIYRDGQYYIIETVSSSKWKVVGILSKDKINANMKYINYVLISIIMICLLIMLVLTYPVVANVTRPIMKLIQGMKQVSKGELQTSIVIESGDEIEEAAQVFNKMVKSIKELIDESVLMEKKKRELALKMFMYQINPHFIYNTLNSVIYLARKANAPDIAVLTKAFISFLQRTIKSQPEMFSSIQDEIKHIDDYTMILQYRYHDRVEIVWNVDENIRECKIPQMILYPLVENSIYHGILPTSREGRIQITITREDNVLTVCVEDNGVGINLQQMENLRAQMASKSIDEVMDHIGLLNVNNRLKLLYGESCILNIDSTENQGTKIWFSILYKF